MTAPLFHPSVPIASAEFSPCRTWRYTLTRGFSTEGSSLVVIGLNPSTATELDDDATIRRCIAFAQRFGHARLIMLNLFGYRSTEPLGLLDVKDPVGPGNDEAIASVVRSVHATVVCAWGSHRKGARLPALVRNRAEVVSRMLTEYAIGTFCFGTNDDGAPKHSLYLPSDAKLRVYP